MSAKDYRFMRKEKDPIIDLMRTEAQRLGPLSMKTGAKKGEGVIGSLAEESGVSETTIRNWFFGDTRCPMRLTTRFVLEAMGISTRYVREDGTIIKHRAGI
jgi:hypothetical protein